jgi:isoquinoline 1-oxidoreductase beta subunit
MRRRTLLLSGAAAGGALLVGWGLLPPRARLGGRDIVPVRDGEVALNGWITIARDGGVGLAMPRSEMGQGVHTALAMLVAEELDIALERVRLLDAGRDTIYGNVASVLATLPLHPRELRPGRESGPVEAGRWIVAKLARELGVSLTAGSSSVADAWEPLRLAAATARAQLVGAASLRWRYPVDEIQVRDGRVTHPIGYHAHFGELAAAAAQTPAGEVHPKPREAWRLIGHGTPRLDAAAQLDGRAVYGLDVRPDGPPAPLLFAAVRMCPVRGGAPQRILDEDEVLRRPGVLRLVRLPPAAGSTAGVAVVGVTTWHARQAVEALRIEWQPPPAGAPDSGAIVAELERQAREALAHDGGHAFHLRGDPRAAEAEVLAAGGRLYEGSYRAPYLAHAALEPVNCTARLHEGRLTLWAATQNPSAARAVAAHAAGLPEEAVTLHVPLLGGAFGRGLDVDAVPQAVAVAQETGGRPVQLTWSREEDFAHDFLRPAAVAVMRAALGADGRPIAWRIASAGDPVRPAWLARTLPELATRVPLPDAGAAEGLYDQPYDLPHQRIAHVATASGVPVGWWRSGGHSHNAFFLEAFVDELAQAARQDAVAFRLALLTDDPRHATVLRLAADKGGWGRPPPPGRALGVALHESFGTIVALVLEVSLGTPPGDGRPRVHRAVCALDCGTVVNPAAVAQQVEGSVVFGLTAALHGRVDIEDGVVRQRNFTDYRLLQLADTPAIETHVVPSERPPSGVGEPVVPTVAPALANALYALTGRRWRELPLRW